MSVGRLLIVAGATAASADELHESVRELIAQASEVLVEAPVLTSKLHLWTNDTDRAREQADERLTAVLGEVEATRGRGGGRGDRRGRGRERRRGRRGPAERLRRRRPTLLARPHPDRAARRRAVGVAGALPRAAGQTGVRAARDGDRD